MNFRRLKLNYQKRLCFFKKTFVLLLLTLSVCIPTLCFAVNKYYFAPNLPKTWSDFYVNVDEVTSDEEKKHTLSRCTGKIDQYGNVTVTGTLATGKWGDFQQCIINVSATYTLLDHWPISFSGSYIIDDEKTVKVGPDTNCYYKIFFKPVKDAGDGAKYFELHGTRDYRGVQPLYSIQVSQACDPKKDLLGL